MALSKQEVEHVARLACLELTENEKEQFTKQLNEILNFVNKLKELPTEGIEPTAHAIPVYNVFREDKVQPSLSAEEALKNAPEREDNYFKVPKIVEG